MANEMLKSIAEDFKSIDPKIAEAKELIAALREAGESTAQLEADLRALELRRDKWGKMLRARGYSV